MMTILLKRSVITALLGVCGSGSFLLTVYAMPDTDSSVRQHQPPRHGRRRAVAAWLGLDEAQAAAVEQADPDFYAESAAMAERLATEKAALAATLEDPETSDGAILEQVERVIAAGNTLERRVARYVVAIRPHLSAGQRHRLMELCARKARRGFRGGRNGATPGSHGHGDRYDAAEDGRGRGGRSGGRGRGGHGRGRGGK